MAIKLDSISIFCSHFLPNSTIIYEFLASRVSRVVRWILGSASEKTHLEAQSNYLFALVNEHELIFFSTSKIISRFLYLNSGSKLKTQLSASDVNKENIFVLNH
jgi:hypothetical protein